MQTAKFSTHRKATLFSGGITADGDLDLDSGQHTPGPKASTVVILPKMMNIYDSVIDPTSTYSKMQQRYTQDGSVHDTALYYVAWRTQACEAC